MRHILLAAALTLCPVTASAIELHWASGSTTLGFTSATRCTLMVVADSAEGVLPDEWHLLWTASNCNRLSIVSDASPVSDTTLAHMSAIGYSTPAEEAAKVQTAGFQAGAPHSVTVARYILDLPAGSAGKLQVVAMAAVSGVPTLLRSGIATFNGAPSRPLPPSILTTATDHKSTRLTVTVTGVGLADVARATVVAPDTSWQVPLTIATSTDSTLTASADLPTPLWAGVLQVFDGSTMSAAPLQADATCGPVSSITSIFGPSSFFKYELFLDPNTTGKGFSTKDFAFYQNITKSTHRKLFHLMYIRHNNDSGIEPSLGHAWSADLQHWQVDTTGAPGSQTASAFFPGPAGSWDRLNVWAPSIVQHGDSTYMFYTGVDATQNQRIGFATTFDLDTCDTQWNRRPTFVLEPESLSAFASPARIAVIGKGEGKQLRDPFVFEHPNPDSAGKFFMVFTFWPLDRANANPSDTSLAMGVARNRTPGSLERWIGLGEYHTTDDLHSRFAGLEGPMLFHDRSASPGWWSMFSNSDESSCSIAPQTIRLERQTPGANPWDTDTTLWQRTALARPDTLLNYLLHNVPSAGSIPARPDSTVWGWEGTEHLTDLDGEAEYLAGFTAWGQPRGCPSGKTGIAIAQMFWRADTTGTLARGFVLDTLLTSPPGVTAVDWVGSRTAGVRLAFVEFRPRSGRISWRITLPASMAVRFSVFDVVGRKRRQLIDSTLPQGSSEVAWDTTDEGGQLVRSGIYYVRLDFKGGVRSATVPVIR